MIMINLTNKKGTIVIIRDNKVKRVNKKQRNERPSLGDLSLPEGDRRYVGEALGRVRIIIRNGKIQEIIHKMKLNKASDEYIVMQGLLELSKEVVIHNNELQR